MGQKWFRCPVCGHIVLEGNLEKEYPVQFFEKYGLGRGRGFLYKLVSGNSLFRKLRMKILTLYHQFFSPISFPIGEVLMFPVRERVSFYLEG